MDPSSDLFAMVKEVHGLIRYGDSPIFLSEEALISRGYGQCGNFVELLCNRLRKRSIEYKIVGLLAHDGTGHGVVEAQIKLDRFTLDPTLGVIYEGGVVDLVRNPTRAVPIAGHPPDESISYFGPRFFALVAYLSIHGLDFSHFNIPEYYLQRRFDKNGQLIISWPPALDVHTVTLTFPRNTKIKAKHWNFEILATNFENISIVPPQGQSSLSVAIIDNKEAGWSVDDFKLTVQATRESGMQVLPVYAPFPTYLAFEGGEALIDSVELRGAVKPYFWMDIGTPAHESAPGQFLYAPELSSQPAGTWGRIIKEEGITYREINSDIQSSTGHAAIQISPLVEGLKDELQFVIRICYKKASDIKGHTSVKFFDGTTDSYAYLGFLSVGESHRCDEFPVPKSAVLSTLGHMSSK